MHPFIFTSASEPRQAVELAAGHPEVVFLAGGTNLIDEMKLDVRTPRQLVDINHLPLDKIELQSDGAVRIGALVRNTELAWNELVRSRYPVLAEAILSGASPQLRNMASTGGNLLQHTRCYYYRDTTCACNMREPGSGCSAIDGFNRIHAVLGASDKCIATHPSDMCVALAALDTVIHIVGKSGERDVAINEFYVPYGDDPSRLNVLSPGDLITYIQLPALPWAKRSRYVKVRDRASYEFALASAAVALDLNGQTIRQARIALGGVATKPWRATAAENKLIGAQVGEASFKSAAREALQGAIPRKFNAFKIELAQRTIVRALSEAAALA
jgi:xanthine dehydrogenase YagS FAD-binding subunit